MDMGWDYQYYQPWSDNEWLLQELMNDNITTEEEGECNDESYLSLSYGQDSHGQKHWTHWTHGQSSDNLWTEI